MDTEKKDFEKLYGDLINSDWFKKAYSAGDCPFNIPEAEESEDERIRKEIIRIVDIWTNSSPVVNGIPRETLLAYLEKHKEQNPIDIDFVSDWLRKHAKVYINSEYNEFHKTVEYDGSINIERLIEDLKKAIEQQPFAHENRRPTELSEEDRLHLNNAILAAEKEWGINSNTAKWLRSFLLSKKTKTIEDAKPEDISETKWSEEDEKTIDEAVKYIENYAEYVQGGFSKQHVLDVARRVDSLRPQPQPHWKPSKEQMEALDRSVDYLCESDNEDAGIMDSLSVDLKKLL